MRFTRLAAVLLSAVTLTACIDDVVVAPGAGAAATAQTPAAQALHKLFADSDEAALKLNPIGALFRGDDRYAGEFGD